MPAKSDLESAASSIFNAGQIIGSSQTTGRIPNLPDGDVKALLIALLTVVQDQNEALESRAARFGFCPENLVEGFDEGARRLGTGKRGDGVEEEERDAV
jgi:hypothetical protein